METPTVTPEARALARHHIAQAMSDKCADLIVHSTIMGNMLNELNTGMELHITYIENLDRPEDEGVKVYVNEELCLEANLEHWDPTMEGESPIELAERILTAAGSIYVQRHRK